MKRATVKIHPLTGQFISLLQDAKKHPFNTVNGWLLCGQIRAYVRCSRRILDGRKVRTLEIANVEVPAKYSRRGLFKGLVELLAALAGKEYEYLYLEQTYNPILQQWARRHGWIGVPDPEAVGLRSSVTFYLSVKQYKQGNAVA